MFVKMWRGDIEKGPVIALLFFFYCRNAFYLTAILFNIKCSHLNTVYRRKYALQCKSKLKVTYPFCRSCAGTALAFDASEIVWISKSLWGIKFPWQRALDPTKTSPFIVSVPTALEAGSARWRHRCAFVSIFSANEAALGRMSCDSETLRHKAIFLGPMLFWWDFSFKWR